MAMKNGKKPDEPAKFWPYLASIARNVVTDVFRYRERTRERMNELAERLRLALSSDPIGEMELREIIDKLRKEEAKVIRMYYIEGYGVDEIAEKLGHKQPWVSKKKTRGEKLLKDLLGKKI